MGIRAAARRFVERGTGDVAPRDAAVVERFNAFSLVLLGGAALLVAMYVASARYWTALIAVLLVVVLLVARRFETSSPRGAAHCAIAGLFTALVLSKAIGFGSAVDITAFTLAPLMAAYVLGGRAALAWGAVAAGTAVAVHASEAAFGWPTRISYSLAKEAGLEVLLIVAVTAIASAAGRAQDRYSRRMEEQAASLTTPWRP